jgi:hypothetical protein
MADLTGAVSFGGFAFAEGTEVWSEALTADLAKQQLDSVEGAILGKVRLNTRQVHVSGLILGTAAAGPRADARTIIDSYTAAFMNPFGAWLQLWADRRVWARCVSCSLEFADPTGYALKFDGSFETDDAYWQAVTPVTSTATALVGNPSKLAIVERNAGTATTPLDVNIRGRVSAGAIKFTNRYNNLINNSSFQRNHATSAGVPADFGGENYNGTGIFYQQPGYIIRTDTANAGTSSALVAIIYYPDAAGGTKFSFAVNALIERINGTSPSVSCQLQFCDINNATLQTNNSAALTTAWNPTTLYLNGLTAPANTYYIKLRLIASVATGGQIVAKFSKPRLIVAATVADWSPMFIDESYSRDHSSFTITGPLLLNEVVRATSSSRKLEFAAPNAVTIDGTPKLAAGWAWPELLPGDNYLFFEHDNAGGTGSVMLQYSYSPRFYTA